MRRIATILGLLAVVAAGNLFSYHFFLRPEVLEAADANVVLSLARDETGAGQTTLRAPTGGWSTYQVTCSTAGSDTWPDTVTLEARDDDEHEWVTVDGHSASTADEREGIYWFARGAEIRVTIADAAGTHSCTATLAFGRFGDY